jgi:hypothetical protein
MNHVKAGFGVLITLLLGIGLFSACSNIFAPPAQPEGSGQKGVTISIAGGLSNIRTLYPSAEFTKYTLEFTGPSSYGTVELNGDEPSVVIDDLADGTWSITAKGWVTIDPGTGPTEFEAAQGDGTITVSGGTAAPVTIVLDAEMGTGNGYLSWDIDIPDDAGIREAYAFITRLSDSTSLPPLNLLTPANRKGIQELPSGYYLVRLSVFNGYQHIGHAEVAAVYSSMETTATYTFTGGDFVSAVKMSGTINLTNTAGVQYINIIPRKDGPNIRGNTVMVSGDGLYSWEIYAPVLSQPFETRFDVEVLYPGGGNNIMIDTGVKKNLSNTDIPDIDLGTVRADAVTIGGTIHFTGIEQELDYIYIYGNSLNNGQGEQIILGSVIGGEADGTWSMKVWAGLAGTPVGLGLLIVPATGNSFYKDLGTVTIDPNITFPPVDISVVTWSGTIDLTVNGVFPSGSAVIQAYDTSGDYWEYIGSSQVNPDGTWSITVNDPYPGNKQIIFELYVGNAGVDLKEMSMPGTTQSGIDLGSYSYITLNGSVAVTWEGTPITSSGNYSIHVSARPNSDYSGYELGYANVNTSGNWTMLVESSPPPRNFYFEVGVYLHDTSSYFRNETGVSRSVSSSPIPDIALGTVAFNP